MKAELAQRYDEAWEDYERRWKPVDEELYELASRRGNSDPGDVYTKVVTINRVYAAGIDRTLGRNGEGVVAQRLLSRSKEVQAAIERIPDGDNLSLEAVSDVLDAHALVTTIPSLKGSRSLRSFASKYLHFHRPCVPIFDDRAKTNILTLMVPPTTGQDTPSLIPDWNWDKPYHGFVLAFWALYRSLKSLGTKHRVTVKGVDHLLWRLDA